MTDHAELRAKAEAATPGPWVLDQDGVDEPNVNYWGRRFIGTAHPDEHGFHNVIADTEDGHGRNAQYIAAASPDVVLGLLDEIARLRRGR